MAVLPMEWQEPAVQPQTAMATIQGGTAEVVRGDSAIVERLGDGSVVNMEAGDLISADTGGVVLYLFDGQTAVLEPSARLSIEKLERREDATWVHLAVWAGRSTFNVPNAPGPDDLFQISSPSSATIIRGTEIAVEVLSMEETIYDVYRGVAYLRLDEQELFVSPNERARAIVDQPLQIESGVRSVPSLQLPITTVGAIRAKATATVSDPAEFWPTPLPKVAPPAIVANSFPTAAADSVASPGDTVSNNNTVSNNIASGDTLYRVQSGDTFWGIAAGHDLTVDALRAANPQLGDVGVLQIGQEIIIPQ